MIYNNPGGDQYGSSENRKIYSSLRKQAELTQEELGEKLGVTNKTISRWENGNYMPDIEMLQLLAKEFHVNINEILAGERMSDAEFRKKADENIIAVSKSSAFSFEEKIIFQKEMAQGAYSTVCPFRRNLFYVHTPANSLWTNRVYWVSTTCWTY